MIAHHRIGADIDGEDIPQPRQPVYRPRLAVLEALAGERILVALKGPPNAAADAVVVRRRAGINLLVSSSGDGGLPLGSAALV